MTEQDIINAMAPELLARIDALVGRCGATRGEVLRQVVLKGIEVVSKEQEHKSRAQR